MRIETARAAGW